jgi:hypothetical protein
MLSAACNGNICFGCRQGTKKVKLEEEKLISAAPPTPEPSPARRSIRARVDETTAIIRNNDMTANCTFLDPLQTSMGQFTSEEFELLSPFRRLMDEPRSPKFYVLLRRSPGTAGKKRKKDEELYITNAIVNPATKKTEHHVMCGFDQYPRVHGVKDVSAHQLALAQHESTLGFDSSLSATHYDGWGSWSARIPTYLLPRGYEEHATSAEWARDMEGMLLAKLSKHVQALGHTFDERLRIAFAHTLDQSKLGSSFSWHRDTEEQHGGRQIKWSMVILLRFDAHGKAAGMQVAGGKASHYRQEGTFHVFDASLYHSTLESKHGGLKLGVFFACPW